MPISDATFRDDGREAAELVDLIGPLVYDAVDEPMTPAEAVRAVHEDDRTAATETHLGERFGVDGLTLTARTVQLALDELTSQGGLTRRVVPDAAATGGVRIVYRRGERDDAFGDHLLDVARTRLSTETETEPESDHDESADRTGEEAARAHDAEPAGPPFERGSILQGRYRLDEHLGGKYHSEVWKATDVGAEDDHAVVVKLATGDGATLVENERAVFERLAANDVERVPALLDSFDVGDDGTAVVKEYVDGMTLRSLVDGADGLSDAETTYVTAELAKLASACHEADVVLYGLFADDVVVTDEADVVVVDVDLADDQTTDRPAPKLSTQTIAPEVVDKYGIDASLGPWSDVFQVGLLALYMRSGWFPTDRPADGLQPADFGVESALSPVVRAATKRHPDDRYRTGRELVAAIERQVEQARR